MHTNDCKNAHSGKRVRYIPMILTRHSPSHWQHNRNLSETHCWHTRGNKHGKGSIFVSDLERERRKERGFVLGVAVWLWGSIGLTSRGLSLWSRKRHRQEVRGGQNCLEILYHYQQGTVSHQGHKTLRGLIGYMCMCECMNCAWQILSYHPRCFTCMLILSDSTWHLWKTSGKPTAIISILFCLS